jgi:beta-phosphoglucomutase
MLQAIIFDFDGTIADSEPLHFQATQKTLAPFGVQLDFSMHLQECAGYPDLENFRRLSGKYQLNLDNEQLQSLILAKISHFHRLLPYSKPCAGAIPLIKAAAECYPLAICTGSHRAEVEKVLPYLDADMHQYFKEIITIDDVLVGKPDPTGYRLTAQTLNILPEHCLAIEDSPAGIIAAKAAGMTVLAVATSYPKEKLSLADHCIASLTDVTLNDLVDRF